MLLRVLLVALAFALAPVSETIAIRAGNLIDPATSTVTKNQVIIVRDGTIAEIGPNVSIPPGATQVDLSTSWVLPGLMDAHTHITTEGFTGTGARAEADYLGETTARRALRGLRNAELILKAGFTTVRDVGNDANYAAVDVREAIAAGWFVGPTVLTTGKIIAPFGGQSAGISPEQGPFWRFEYIDADTVDEVRKAVRQNIYYGADAIKLVADNSRFHYTREEIAAAVAEAHSAGLPVSVHVLGGEAAMNVILGGADSIEHGYDLTDDMLRLMKGKNIALVSTDFPEEHRKMMGLKDTLVGGRTVDQRIVDRLRRAIAIGTPLVFGSDTFLNHPTRTKADLMLDYFDRWQAIGVPAMTALKAMTINAAELLRIQKTRGRIAPGMAADIIATATSPLEDLRALRKVHFVMKNGVVVKQLTAPLTSQMQR
jgi:imidazolonepropionase-like amidohydrolase